MWFPGELIIEHNGKQVAGVSPTMRRDDDTEDQFHIRNVRPNGTVGICHRGSLLETKQFLDHVFPGWTSDTQELS